MERNSDGRSIPSRPGLSSSSTAQRSHVAIEPDDSRVNLAPSPRAKSRKPRAWAKYLVAAMLVVVTVAALVWLLGGRGTASDSIDRGKYQAIFLTTNELYFGKLSILTDGFFKLDDVYYIRKKPVSATDSDALQQSTGDTSNAMELIKLGSELHSPTDSMVFNRDQVLYFENIKSDGVVAKKIAEEKDLSRR